MIKMERIHRALRPKGRETDPPRDIICCIVDYKLKEDILRQARGRLQLIHDGANIQIYQDLSSITMQHRRDLKLLLDVLRSKGIQYRWKFPFCLSVTHQSHTALLKVPEDLRSFCDTLGIPLIEVPNWYIEFRHPTTRRDTPQEEPMDAQDTRFRRRGSPSGPRHHTGPHDVNCGSSPTNCPRSRRPRRDH